MTPKMKTAEKGPSKKKRRPTPKTRLKIPDFPSLGKPTTINVADIERELACETSREVVQLLSDNKISQKKIAEMMGRSPSFISRVNNGTRNLSIKDLEQLEKTTKIPVPLLLAGRLKNKKNVPAHLKKFYAAAEEALKASL